MFNSTGVKKADDDLHRQNYKLLEERIKNGDLKAFEEIISNKIFCEALAKSARYKLEGTGIDPQDITQETIFYAWQQIEQFRGEASFLTYVQGIQNNLIKGKYTEIGKRREREISIDEVKEWKKSQTSYFLDDSAIFIDQIKKQFFDLEEHIIIAALDYGATQKEIGAVRHITKSEISRRVQKMKLKAVRLVKNELPTPSNRNLNYKRS